MKKPLRVGVVGYCPPTKFDVREAAEMISEAYERIHRMFPDREIVIVSGLCKVGVLMIAYTEAAARGWKTIGVACEKAKNFEHFPVDEKYIVGENWGDESPTFLGMIDAMIRIGVGKQSLRETEAVRNEGKPTFEYYLPVLE
jgi:hypothetical protein